MEEEEKKLGLSTELRLGVSRLLVEFVKQDRNLLLKINSRLIAMEKLMTDLRTDLQTLTSEEAQLAADVTAILGTPTDAGTLRQQVVQLTNQLATAQTANAALQGQVNDLVATGEIASSTLAQLNATISSQNDTITNAKQTVETVNDGLAALHEQMTQVAVSPPTPPTPTEPPSSPAEGVSGTAVPSSPSTNDAGTTPSADTGTTAP